MRTQTSLHTGDFIIRHVPGEDLWHCWLIGASAPYDAIIGTGKYPVRAMASWNVQANEAKKKIEMTPPAPKAEPVKRRGWWRQ